jgi:crotonobetainyl-CoA:carnitine CoA-transferase CaiB-like acyl-CoA transferase
MPLEGIRVIDWTMWQQGPVAAMMLGDLGAEVIKIEASEGGDPGRGVVSSGGADMRSGVVPTAYFEGNNRNKKGMSLNLKEPAAREVMYRLVAKSDVFVHNFRPGVPERLQIGYEDLKRHNEKLIYAAASGFGPRGPDTGAPSMDLIGQARSGLMMAMGEPGTPPQQLMGGVSDQIGAMMLCHGVMAALLARERHGVGQRVDTSQLGSMAWAQGLSLSSKLMVGTAHQRVSRTAPFNVLWNYYRCADDRWIAFAMTQADRYWADFCRVIEREDMIDDERFSSMMARAQHTAACVEALDDAFSKRTCEAWLRRFRSGGDFILAAVSSVDELVDDVQIAANEYVTEFEHPSYGTIRQIGIPVQLSETPGRLRLPAPEHGQHTEEILTELLGYSWDEIGQLRERKAF